MHPACKYSFAVHTTAEADEYHQDSCVKNWMSRMADSEGCIAYMSGISEGNPDMAACSVHDLGKICEQQAVHFRQSDAEALCAATNQAATQFWHARAQKMAQGVAAGHINQGGCSSDNASLDAGHKHDHDSGHINQSMHDKVFGYINQSMHDKVFGHINQSNHGTCGSDAGHVNQSNHGTCGSDAGHVNQSNHGTCGSDAGHINQGGCSSEHDA